MKQNDIYLPIGTALVAVEDNNELGCELCFFDNARSEKKVIYKLEVINEPNTQRTVKAAVLHNEV